MGPWGRVVWGGIFELGKYRHAEAEVCVHMGCVLVCTNAQWGVC